MKYITIILLNSFLFINILMGDDFCLSQNNCIVVNNDRTGDPDTLSCNLSSMNNLTIYAPHVLTKNGILKEYWSDKKNVCTVLEWINDGMGALDKMNNTVTGLDKPITVNLNLIHMAGKLTGNSYLGLNLNIDIDKKDETGIDYIDKFSLEECDFEEDDVCDSSSDGNDLVVMRPYQTVHEMFHFIQEQTAKLTYK